MTEITQNIAAALAAVLIVTVSMAEVVTVPPAHAAQVVMAPELA
jgi:hypothetical protein